MQKARHELKQYCQSLSSRSSPETWLQKPLNATEQLWMGMEHRRHLGDGGSGRGDDMGGIRGGSGGKGSSQCGPRCPSASASQNGSATEALLGSTADIFSEAITIQAMCSQRATFSFVTTGTPTASLHSLATGLPQS